MSKKDDGEQVYPRGIALDPKNSNPHFTEGISRRNWLAGLAMQGMLASGAFVSDKISESAYEQADAMIEQGNKT